jgi:hypothetical protein
MRKTLLILSIGIIAVAGGVALFTYGDRVPPAAVQNYGINGKKGNVPFQEIVRGDHSKISVRKNYIITSSAEFTELWKLIGAPGVPPTIDFKTDSVIAVFTGNKPTAGYSIEVASVEDGVSRKVQIMLANPGGSCLLAQSSTAPFQVIQLAKTSLALTHEDIVITKSCLR